MANLDAGAVLRSDINTMLEEASQAESMFIGRQVMPVYLASEKTGQYPKFRLGKGELLNDDATIRTPTGSYGKIYRAYESDTYTCVDRGLEELVDDTYREDVARYFDAEVTAARQIQRQVLLSMESRIASAIMTTANFTATAASVAYTEANLATMAVILDVTNAIGRLNDKGVIPNTIVMSKNVFLRSRRSTDVISYIRGSKGSDSKVLASASDFAAIFADDGIKQCLVGRAPKNSAKKGQAYSASSVWGDTYFWVGYVAGGDFMGGGAGRTIVWNAEGGETVTETYRNEEVRSDVVRVRQNTAEKVVDTTAGELITTSYA